MSSKLCVICQRADPYRPDLACICAKCGSYVYTALLRHDWSADLSILRLWGTATADRRQDEIAATRARNSIKQIDFTAEDAPTT